MEKIEIKVTKTNISLTNGYVLNQGEYQVDKCKFTFSEEYEDLVKKAVFVNSDTSIDMVILNDECDIPYEILQTANEFTLKVYGYQVQDEELVQRYSPTALKIFLREGSYVGSNEVITPSQFEQYEQALHDGLDEIDDKMQEIETEVDGKIQEVDDKLTEVDGKIDEIDTAITETNNLDLNVSDKVGKDVTITLTKKDASTKTVTLSDGTSLMFNWQGTSLGIKTDEDEEYTYVNLQGQIGPIGPQGDPFQVKKTYTNVDLMKADYDNMEINDYVMISGNVEQEDNAKLFVKTEVEDPTYRWQYLADFSGASGIQGPTGATPNLQIGTVVTGETSSASITGTAENPKLNLTLQKGDKGNTGDTGATGNGISSITKTGTSGYVDTYTIAYTNGTSTTFDVTNGEVSQAQLDETNERVERAEMVYNALPKVNGSGEVITLDNTAETPLKMELSGNTSQETTSISGGDEYDSPSPDHPQDIEVVSGNNKVVVCGKNLIPLYTPNSVSSNGITATLNSDNSITLSGTATANASFSINKNGSLNSNVYSSNTFIFELDSSKTYTLSKVDDTSNSVSCLILESETSSFNHVAQISDTQISQSFTGYSKYRIRFTITNGTTINETIKLQLEKGNTATTYEPYQSQEYSVNLGSLELCKIGDYKDYIYKDNGSWCKYKEVEKVTLNGSENWNFAPTDNVFFYFLDKYLVQNAFSNYFVNIVNPNITNNSSAGQNLQNNQFSFRYGVTDRMYIKDTSITSVDDFKTWLSTHNTTVYYVLNQATNEPITDTTLINQLDLLEKAYAYQNQTNISQSNNEKPFVIDAETVRDLSNIFDI